MSVTKYKEVRWRVRVPDGKGGMRHVGIYDRKREAVEAERVALSEGNTPKGEMRVRDWRRLWIDSMFAELGTSREQRRESTVLSYEAHTAAFAEAYGHLRLADVKVSVAREWTLERPSQQAALRIMYADARLADVIGDYNPFARLRMKRSRGRRDLAPGFLTPAMIDRLAEAAVEVHDGPAGPMVAALIHTAAETGIRRGELIALRWSDLDLDRGEAMIERAWNARLRRVDLPKNGLGGKVVLGPKSIRALRKIEAARLHSDLVFTTITGKPLNQSGLHYLLNPVRQRAGVPHLTLHLFRHYCATQLVEAGVSDFDVARQLRHTDRGDLVRQLYAHRDDDAALARVRAALGGEHGPQLTRAA
ncbi:MAG: site-specific integrase [Actinomycetes bacterium]